MTTQNPTIEQDLDRARDVLRGDWDEGDYTLIGGLPEGVAEALLEIRGWSRGDFGSWIAPDGARYWHRSEAVQVALVAEAAAAAASPEAIAFEKLGEKLSG